MEASCLFRIVVWHRDAVNGTHQSTLLRASSAAKALERFGEHLKKVPAHLRSFGPHNLVQLHGPSGKISDIPHIAS